MTRVDDLASLTAALAKLDGPAVLGFFGDFSPVAKKTRPEFEAFCQAHATLPAFTVDVGAVKDVHPKYGVSAVPTVVLVEGGRVTRRAMGATTADGYVKLLLEAPAAPAGARDAKAGHRVTVYTTPSCSWCTRVKSYLNGHGVSYSEVDVAKDDRARDRMVARSGQMGVPQLDIDGRMVVGFDKPRIDQLLGLGATP
jgi:glutaredoxin-like YruB-family protein